MNYRFYLTILIFSLAVSIIIQLTVPYPYGLLVSLGIFMAFPYILKKMTLHKIGGGFTKRIGFNFEGIGKLSKVCLSCGKNTNSRICGRCGSKSFRYS